MILEELNRDYAINYFKSLLVIGMIIGHCVQLLTDYRPQFIEYFSDYINLITFSGFTFSFGYVYYKAYIKKNILNKKRFLIPSYKTLFAFYISGFFFRLLVIPGRWLTFKEYVKILLLWDIPGYSEFLLSFFIISLLFCILFKCIKKYFENDNLIFIAIILSLAMTFFPYKYILINEFGLIIGSNKFPCFPIIQYSCLFFIGFYFAKNNIKYNKIIFVISCITLIIFLLIGSATIN